VEGSGSSHGADSERQEGFRGSAKYRVEGHL
jgi:hypothetical protein